MEGRDLRKAGLKVTSPRLKVLEVLEHSRQRHLSAEAIYRALLDSGEEITAHCANPGAMLGLTTPGARVWLSRSEKPGRKLPWSWELVEVDFGHGTEWVGVNTAHPNAIVSEAVTAGFFPHFAAYPRHRREVKYGLNSRIDILLEGAKKRSDEQRPSMAQDIAKGRRTETDFINGYVAAKGDEIRVPAPIHATVCIASGDAWKNGNARATRNTPAVTIVAAWMRAETGVGPSIASGSHT